MEIEKKLYPIKFVPIVEERDWGQEEFVLADLGYKDSFVRDGWLASNTISELMDTYMDRVVGERVYDYYGRQFPICIKRLIVNAKTPLQVHPDDEIAAERYDLLGKEKLWYVLSAGKDAQIGLGFKADSDASELYSACVEGRADSLINIIAPYAGQALIIPSGTPHFAKGQLELIEIAESSPLDFCLCAWGQELMEDEFDENLGLTDALDFISYSKIQASSISAKDSVGELLADLQQLKIRRIKLDKALKVSGEEMDNFALYTCVSGAAVVQLELAGQELNYALTSGESILVPAECNEFYLLPKSAGTCLLETVVERVEQDKYIDPNAEAQIEE